MSTIPASSKDTIETRHHSPALNCPDPAGAILSLVAILILLLRAGSAYAASLFWDAGNTNNGATSDPGSGSWNTDTTTNLNWNNGSANVSWTQNSTTSGANGAIFNGPGAADNTYQIAVDGGQVAATNLAVNASGYTFSGSPIYLNNSSVRMLAVSNGVSVTFSNNLTGNNGNAEIQLGDNGPPATMVVYGTMTGWQPQFSSTNGSVVYLAGSGTSSAGTTHVNADVRMTNGTFNSGGAFVIGRVRGTGGSWQPNNSTGKFTLDGPTTVFNQNSDFISIGRDSVWNSTLIIQNGATLNFQTGARNNNFELGIPRPGSSGANNQSWVRMLGGTLNMGPGSDPVTFPRSIKIADGGSRVGQISVLTQSGGVINAWAGIQIGGSGTYDGGTGALTNSGGFLYLGGYGGNGIRYGTSIPPTNWVSLSGGTVGALQNWISSVPMILDAINGNITFQSADSGGNPLNISLSGALKGPGGLNKTGGGMLTLSGANNYSGSTVVSNGVLVISTINAPTNGAVVVDGASVSAGLPIVSNIVANVGQKWSLGDLTFSAGTPTISLNFGSFPPSTTVAPLQANGNLAFTVTPNVVVDGTAIPVGTYPLIKYTGTLSGTPPTALVSLPPGVTAASIVNNTANKSIDLQVTGSTVNPALKWLVGNGVWDTSTANWTQGGGPTLYTDNGTKDVVFDDSASGASPITVTINTSINNPRSVTANNATKQYIISGPGILGGTNLLAVTGAGSLTLATTNTYSGGTTVSSPGQLNINYGGNGGSNSAIGIGSLNLNTGAKLDNTSGHTVVLNTTNPIPINWNDDWTFVGTTNLDLGLGQVTMGNSQVILTVNSNTLTVNNPITDNGLNYQLIKAGNGTLTLSNGNNFAGGLTHNAGTLNLNHSGAAGFGLLRINGGVLDNTSGADVTLFSPSALELLASFTFNGTTNLDLGPAPTTIGNNTITLNGTGALITEGSFTGGNRQTIVNGTGKWIMGGDGNNANLGTIINGGTVYYNKNFPFYAQNSLTTVNTSGTLVMMSPTGFQMLTTAQLVLGGGTVDLNGDSETIQIITFNSGIVRNSAVGTTSTLTVNSGITMGSVNCAFDVTDANSSLIIPSPVVGTGSLTKTGAGSLILSGTNSYSGNTTINAGALNLSHPGLATTATVAIATNALLGLNFENLETNVVGNLVLNGVSVSAGIHNATTDPAYITGGGNLLVVPPINPNPGTILFGTSGGNLTLAWPTNGGWILQTNAANITATGAWFPYPGSTAISNLSIPVSLNRTNVFFRLVKP